jgi:CHAD domain-containing protein
MMKPPIDHSVVYLACRTVRRYAEMIQEHLEGACTGQQVEDIHQVRVCGRRLRAALRLFEDCFDPKPFGRWQRQVKRVLKRLGQARDRDVQIDFLNQILKQISKSDKKIRPGIQRIRLRWKQHRKRLQPKVAKTVSRLRDSGILEEIQKETRRILRSIRNRKPSVSSPAVVERAGGQIHQRLEDLLGRQECLDNPADKVGHHAMRIAAKRLRYTMEICGPAFEDRLKPCIKTLKQLQTMLGDLHDCDVWIEQITEFKRERVRRSRETCGSSRAKDCLGAGLDYLGKDRRDCRKELFQQIRSFCQQLNKKGFWESIRKKTKVKPEKDGKDSRSPDNHG